MPDMPKETKSEKDPKTASKSKKASAKKKTEIAPKAATKSGKAASSPKKAADSTPRKAPVRKRGEVTVSREDIALRAYYISERRQAMGWPGDETGDWVEAERQLLQEAKEAAKKKSA